MIDAQLNAFLSRIPSRTGNWPNAGAHVATGVGVILRVQRVRAAGDVNCETQALAAIDPGLLDEFLDAVTATDVAFTSVAQTYERLIQGRDGRMACFTFDGAVRGMLDFAYPALKRRGIPLTVFISPDLVDGPAPWWLALEALALQTDRISIGVRGQTFKGRCHTPEEKAETLDNLVPLLLAQPEGAVRRAITAVCEADGVDVDAITAAARVSWNELRHFTKDPLVSIGLLAPDCHAGGSASYDVVRDSLALAAARLHQELGVQPVDLAFGAGWHGFVEQRDLEIAKTLGFRTACLPSGGALFAEDATDFMILPRMLVSDSPDALLDAQAVCGAALPVVADHARKASAA